MNRTTDCLSLRKQDAKFNSRKIKLIRRVCNLRSLSLFKVFAVCMWTHQELSCW